LAKNSAECKTVKTQGGTPTVPMDAPAEYHAHPLKLLRPELSSLDITGFTFTTLFLKANTCD